MLKIGYKIIGCPKCGTICYILKEQKTRQCSKCGFRINCEKCRVLSKASTINEAQAIVKTLKTPSNVIEKINEFSHKIQSHKKTSSDKYDMLGNLISDLLTIFPNAMPEKLLYQKAQEIEIEESFLSENLEKFQTAGYILRNTDKMGNKIIKFINTPFTMGKITVLKPK